MRIHTERLILREFVAEDWPAILAYQRNPRYLRFYPWTDRTEVEVQDFVQMFVDHQSVQPRRKFQLAITLPGDDRVIAQIGLLDPGEGNEIRFVAPGVGLYQFVCTFPGHNITMFGEFNVVR